MQNKEFKRHIAYEVLTILGTLALLLFVCRLWPILLLVILGIFIAAMRLLFLSARKVENIPPLLPAARPEPTDQDIRDMAFGSMQRRITELVTADFPNARWVWKTPILLCTYVPAAQGRQHFTAWTDLFAIGCASAFRYIRT